MQLRTEQKIKIMIFFYSIVAGIAGAYSIIIIDRIDAQEEKDWFLFFLLGFNSFMIGFCLSRIYKAYRLYLSLKREGWRSNW